MRKQVAISIFAATLIALSAGSALAKSKTGSQVTGTPPHASTTGMDSRASVASKHGANKKGFCPPGQAKKPGRGSAFNC
jgi:hypothetical protein